MYLWFFFIKFGGNMKTHPTTIQIFYLTERKNSNSNRKRVNPSLNWFKSADEEATVSCTQLWEEFNEKSTLHGTKYITEKGSHPLQR
jgi:hypothetical protein